MPRSAAPSTETPSSSSLRSPSFACGPPRGGSIRSTPAVKTASRPPWRVAARATTCATPSATSDFSRSAVPNAIEAEMSSTSQVVRIRSGTCRRTCAVPVRALAAGSSWRTSSPSW